MRQLTLKGMIIRYFREHPDIFIHSGDVEKMAMYEGFKGSTAGRELRTLAELGRLERDERRNPKTGVSSVWYRFIPNRYEAINRQQDCTITQDKLL